MTVRIILTLNLFYKPLCIIKSSDQDLTESELLYLFQANEPFLIFRDSLTAASPFFKISLSAA